MGLVYPLQNLRASKLDTHGFASKSDTHGTKEPPDRVAFVVAGVAPFRGYSAPRAQNVGPHLSRKPSGSSLTSGSAKNPREASTPLCYIVKKYCNFFFFMIKFKCSFELYYSVSNYDLEVLL